MKDDKFCFSKTLTYLVLLVAVVFGAFWVMNYSNTQKLGANPKAATGDCIVKVSGVSYSVLNTKCLKDLVKTTYFANTSYKCVNGNPWGKSKDCTPAGATAPTCVAGKITDKSGADGCYYQRGPGKISNGRCIVDSTSGAACAPDVGSVLAGAAAVYDCTFRYGTKTYRGSVDECFAGKTSTDATTLFPSTMSEKCVAKGVVRKTAGCATGAAAAPTCTANEITFVDTDVNGSKWCQYKTGVASGGRCVLATKAGSVCDTGVGSLLGSVSAATGCKIPYGGKFFELAVGDCLKNQASVNGVYPPVNSTRCNSIGSYGKNPSCAPKCAEYPSCPEGITFGNSDGSGATCGCFDLNSTTEKPSMQ